MKKAEKLTLPARKVLCEAFSFAAGLGCSCVSSEHLLLGLVQDEKSPLSRMLSEHGISKESLSGLVRASTASGAAGELPFQGLSESGRRILSRAAQEAAKSGMASVAAEHLFLAILSDRDCGAAKLLKKSGADPSNLAEELFFRAVESSHFSRPK